MKRTPPPLATGYRLEVSRVHDASKQSKSIRVVLETSQAFASFVYDLSVKEERQGNHVRFKVLGLKPPQLSIPSSGRARFMREYDDLAGTFDITIEGIDGTTNTFKFRLSSGRVTLIEKPKEQFTEVIV